MPTLTICTDVFETLAHAERESLGAPDLALLVIGHPLASRTAEEIEDLADELLPAILEHLVAGPRSAP